MYLVDTSVWIDYLGRDQSAHTQLLHELLANPLAVGINHFIYMEILQGARDQARFDKLQRYFSGQTFYSFENAHSSYEQAARLYFECRRAGVTIRSTVDCLIAQCAIENDLVLLHNDQDFIRLAQVEPALKQKSFLH